MEMGSFRDLAGVLATFFAGAIVLAPVLAWSLRVALKPLTETMRYRSDPKLLGRVEKIEEDLRELRQTVARSAEQQRFDRSLPPAAAAAPRPRAPSPSS